MQNKNKMGPRLNQNWPLTSGHGKTSIFRNKPPDRVWGPQLVLKLFQKEENLMKCFRVFFKKCFFMP